MTDHDAATRDITVPTSLRSALLLVVGIAFTAGLLPAGVVLDRWLMRELERRTERDLAAAPRLVVARDAALHDAMMMHAKELAHEVSVTAALRANDRMRGVAVVEPTARSYNYGGVLLASNGDVWLGPAGAASLADATRAGEMPVRVVADEAGLHLVSVAPVFVQDRWLGAAGVTLPLDGAAASALAGMTRSDAVLLIGAAGELVAAPDDSALGIALARAWRAAGSPHDVREWRIAGARYAVSAVATAGATALFVRDLQRELAILHVLRQVVLVTGAGALAVALLLAFLLAGRLTRPVRELANAADRLSGGDFAAPLPHSSLHEVARVTDAFAHMRRALALRLDELRSANRMLEERQARLSALQAELIKRERVATSARMAAELAHEIRNPVANIRNCLELLERRLGHDPEAREFASLAVDELLRMHELAERMLQLNRPRAPEIGTCDAIAVARDVIALMQLGNGGTAIDFSLDAEQAVEVAMPADALKQVLSNLVQNARDAQPDGVHVDIRIRATEHEVRIAVSDDGPGIPIELREQIFDPFFTTRSRAGGVGLGLFLVEAMVRGHGGSVSLHDRRGARGACFELTLPATHPVATAPAQSAIPVAAEA